MPACTDRSALERRAEAAQAQRLVGTWDVRFHLERSPVLTVDARSVANDVRGELALVTNPWLDASYPEIKTPTNYGTYDIDFRPFGFDPRSAGQTPAAVAGWLTSDSLEIILNPDRDQTAVAMRGQLRGDSISGTWDISVSRAAGGSGRFVMSRRRER